MKVSEAHFLMGSLHKNFPQLAAQILNLPCVLEPLSDWALHATGLALMGSGGSLDELATTEDVVEAIRRCQRMAVDGQANFADWWEACEKVQAAIYEEQVERLREHEREPWEPEEESEECL